MSFHRFKGIWVITDVELLSSETIGHRIAIGGSAANVMILCVENPERHVHPPCRFDKETDRIVGPTFEISRTSSRPRRLLCESSPINTGSWTAEDPGGMDGNGDDE